jgi:hypothetical protein
MLWTTKRPYIVSVLRVKYKVTISLPLRGHYTNPVPRIQGGQLEMVAGERLHALEYLNIRA